MRVKVLGMVEQKTMTLKHASHLLGVSYRQAKRLSKRYREEGEQGLIHRNVGAPSHRRIVPAERALAVQLYQSHYADFGPTLASEKLFERHNLTVDHETLRRWLIAEGVWTRKRKRRSYRQRRLRRECFGELVQFDGSHHDWFEGRSGRCCLMNMVDDATGKTLSFLCEQETTVAAMQLLWRWIELYGIPQAVYCDRKNAFVLNREPTIEEQLSGVIPRSPFKTACDKLGIEVIVAYSPQAKGRVERNHRVYQDRLVKELRLQGSETLEDANAYLANEYLHLVNTKFAKEPACSEDGHSPLLNRDELNNIFCFEALRVVSNDYVVQYSSRCYQIQKSRNRPHPDAKVIVRKWLDDTVHFFWQGKEIQAEEILLPGTKEVRTQLSA